jgi:hypothetical protein
MSRKMFLALTVLALTFGLSACGSVVKESVAPVKNSLAPVSISDPNKVMVVLPFADYSRGDTPDDYLRRQVKLQEALSYYLSRYGYLTPMREDVTQCLVDLDVIKVIDTGGTYRSQALMRELGGGWSEDMLKEIRSVVAINEVESGPRMEVTHVGLNGHELREISRRFNAGYLLRGRIVEYEMRTEHTLNPLRRGVLPFFFDVSSQFVFGVADSETYDLIGDLVVGGGLGALIGSEVIRPFTPPHKSVEPSGHPLFGGTTTKVTGGEEDYAGYNALFWGSIGAGAAYLAKHGGQAPQAVVQVSMALQDARSGAVVWSNRAEVAVAPVSAWADQAPRTLMDRAVEVATEKLVQELASGPPLATRVAEASQPIVSGSPDTDAGHPSGLVEEKDAVFEEDIPDGNSDQLKFHCFFERSCGGWQQFPRAQGVL